MVLTQGIVSYERGETARLVFNCYDRRCFFAQAWLNAGSIGRMLLNSKEEQELASTIPFVVLVFLLNGRVAISDLQYTLSSWEPKRYGNAQAASGLSQT